MVELASQGATYRQIQASVGISAGSVANILRPLWGLARVLRPRRESELTRDERITIEVGVRRGASNTEIAGWLGRDRTTVWREISRNGGRASYSAGQAEYDTYRRAARPKPHKLVASPRLAGYVTAKLELEWSPAQISARLVEDFPDDPEMRISHETIYRSLYVQGRGGLRKELHRALRTGRAKRVRRDRTQQRARFSDMVMITERPAEVADRAVPGHWEGDLILGKNNKSQIGTLVERTTRYVLLLHLPEDRTAASVRTAMAAKIAELPDHLARSMTWDQGSEMAEHARFTIDTDIPVFFCDPASPWQRGSNENTNGLLRQYFPKGTDLSTHTPEDLDAVATRLNGRPRQTLGWKTPADALQPLVAPTG